jgi:TetR/AcrR family transcriptional regulator
VSSFVLARESRGKRERRKEARPAELLEAALDLFVEKGFAATRAEEVAARAGVSKGTLFLYFPSKEHLLNAVVRENIARHLAVWNDELNALEGSASEMIRSCFRVWWERIGKTRSAGVTKLVISEASNFPELAATYHREVLEPTEKFVRQILQQGIVGGEFHIEDLDYASMTIAAAMNYLPIAMHLLGGYAPSAFDPVRYLKVQADVILDGLCARPLI